MDSILYDGFFLMLANLHFIFLGVSAGMIIGATPGLSASNSTAILLPFILILDPTTGIIFILSIHAGSQMGNSFPAILLNIPGTPSSAVTTLEGYPMACRGLASKALGICVLASCFGSLIGAISSVALIPQLADMALQFSSVEIALVILLGIVIIGQISSGGIFKGLLSGFFGLLVSTTGTDPMWGQFRGTFGFVNLIDGMPIIPSLIGLLAFSEVIILIGKMDLKAAVETQEVGFRDILSGFKSVLRRPIEVLRSSVIGTLIGVIPGAGGSVAAPIAYQQSILFSSEEEKKNFGKGSVNGLIAADAANNGMVGGSLVPLLTLAVPGCATGAVLLVAFSYHGLIMGPELFQINGPIAYAILFSQFPAALFILLTGTVFAWFASKVVNIQMTILVPIISILTYIGGFSPNQVFFDIWIVLVMGILGYFMKKYNYVPLAFLLGLVLGSKFEENLFQGLRMGLGSPTIFFNKPIAQILWGILILVLLYPAVCKAFIKYRNAKKTL